MPHLCPTCGRYAGGYDVGPEQDRRSCKAGDQLAPCEVRAQVAIYRYRIGRLREYLDRPDRLPTAETPPDAPCPDCGHGRREFESHTRDLTQLTREQARAALATAEHDLGRLLRRGSGTTEVAAADLLAAWSVLENLAVSLDQIGGTYGVPVGEEPTAETRRALREALAAYLSPALVAEIAEARRGLARYIPDEVADAEADRIPYWDYHAAGSATGPSPS